jgi:hypothetical protein
MLYLQVSKQLPNVNEKAYTPNLVSIGPFHRKVDGLKDMKMQKLGYFKDFFGSNRKESGPHLEQF